MLGSAFTCDRVYWATNNNGGMVTVTRSRIHPLFFLGPKTLYFQFVLFFFLSLPKILLIWCVNQDLFFSPMTNTV